MHMYLQVPKEAPREAQTTWKGVNRWLYIVHVGAGDWTQALEEQQAVLASEPSL